MAKKHKAPPFKIPRQQMSKFDPKAGMITIGGSTFKAETVEVTTSQEHGVVQGCGNPNCPTCMPKDGKGGDVRFSGGGGSAGGNSYDAYVRSQMEQMARNFMGKGITFEFIASGGEKSGGESAAYRQAREKVEKYILTTAHDLQWDDVVGNEAARTALIEAIEAPVRHAELYAHYGQKPLKGVMLHGPPGCGKTMFGKAAASVIGRLHGQKALLIKIDGPEIQSPYVGITEGIIRDIFAFARIYAKEKGHPLTIFIDEADAILPSRSGRIASFEMSNVATFLAEMDGLAGSGAFVILATNRPEAIDAALLRDGRCDRKIKVERPTREAARAILRKGLAGAPLAGELDELVAKALLHFYSHDHVLGQFRVGRGKDAEEHPFHLHRIVNGAMLVGLVERAKAIAFRRDLASSSRSGIGPDDLRAAIDAVLVENRGMDHGYATQEFLADLVETIGETVH